MAFLNLRWSRWGKYVRFAASKLQSTYVQIAESPYVRTALFPERWLYIECYRKRAEAPRPIQLQNTIPYKLFLAGFILTAIGSILIAFAPLFGTSLQGGGFVWIFPFPPFFFGSRLNGEIAVSALILLIAILLLAIVRILLFHRRSIDRTPRLSDSFHNL